MSYKIEATIKGEKYVLNKVGPPTYLEKEPEMLQKTMWKGYISQNFRDIMTSLDDLQEVKYLKGNKILIQFKY